MALRIGAGGGGEDPVERRAGGAEVGDRGAGQVLVLELLGHGADHGAEMLVLVPRGAAIAGEDRAAEVVVLGGGGGVVGRWRRPRVELDALHGRRRRGEWRAASVGGGGGGGARGLMAD